MDTRLPPLALFGLRLGDAHVLRNAGGRVTPDVLRSLVLSTWTMGTRRLSVVHHTDCGLLEGSPGEAARRIRAAGGPDYVPIPLLGFDDLDRSVATDVAAIRSERALPRDLQVRGYVVDVATGDLREVEVDERGRVRAADPMPQAPPDG